MLSRSTLCRVFNDVCRFSTLTQSFKNVGNSDRNFRIDDVRISLCGVWNINYHTSSSRQKTPEENETEVFDLEKERNKLRSGLTKYEEFKDEDSPVILDIEEERLHSQTRPVAQQTVFEDISLERGLRGVFDTEELVCLLKGQNAEDIVVIEMPQNVGYADHMIIISGKSSRHLHAMATHVRLLFKKKMHKSDKIPIIEGKKNKNEDWLALDLGNIVLHLFSKSTRQMYDLESLWTLGPEFDPLLNQTEDPISAILSKHSLSLGDLQPADSKEK